MCRPLSLLRLSSDHSACFAQWAGVKAAKRPKGLALRPANARSTLAHQRDSGLGDDSERPVSPGAPRRAWPGSVAESAASRTSGPSRRDLTGIAHQGQA